MTHFDEHRAYEFMKRLSFVRPSGSAEEKRAAELIAAECRAASLEPRIEPFPVWTYEEEPCRVEVRNPYQATLEAAPCGLTGVTDPEGTAGELVFVETGEQEFLEGLAGRIALVYGSGTAQRYERLAKSGLKAVIRIGEPGKELSHVSISDAWFKRFGKLPTVFVRYEDALGMLKREAREVTVVCRQREIEGQSRNVVVDIPGTRPAVGGEDDEIIILCGHYDTVPFTVGAHDNAGGSAILMELARLLAARPARRTVRVVWFGAEELGLYGSQAYVAALKGKDGEATGTHQEAGDARAKRPGKELDRIKLVVNVDVAGGTIGRNHCTVTGPEAMKNYVEVLGKEVGVGLESRLGVMSSDGTPFGLEGVPSVNFARYGGGTANLHTPQDALEHTDSSHLAMLGRFAEIFVDRVANARAFPFDREMPESVKKDLEKYREESMGLEKREAPRDR